MASNMSPIDYVHTRAFKQETTVIVIAVIFIALPTIIRGLTIMDKATNQ